MSRHSIVRARPWAVRAIALLLLLQAIGLVAINVYHIYVRVSATPNLELPPEIDSDEDFEKLSPAEQETLMAFAYAFFLMPLAIPATLAAIGFLFLFRFGWVTAMLTQVATLAICLMLYLEFKPIVVYPIMVYCILMVLYLNVNDVRLTFFTRKAREEIRGAG